jgi:hypothetical protein
VTGVIEASTVVGMVHVRSAVVVGALALSALTMSGCATATADASVAVERPVLISRYSTPESATVAPTMTQDTYLVTIAGLLSGRPHADQSDDEYIQGGRDICADFDAGANWDTYSDGIAEIGGDLAFYRAAVRAAIYTFCPQHATRL